MKKQLLDLSKDSIIYGFSGVILRSIGIITLPIFTAYLTKEDYGILAMLGLLTMVVQPIFGLGVGVSMGLCYFEKDNLRNKSQSVWSAFTLNLFSSMILVFIGIFFTDYVCNLIRLNSTHGYLVQISIISVAFTILTNSFSQRVIFEKQSLTYVLVAASKAVISISICIYAIVFSNIGVIGMLYGQLAGNIFSFSFFFMLGFSKTHFLPSLSHMKEILRQGLPLVPSFAFVFFIMHSNKYILEYYHGLTSVGIYSVGFSLGVTISIITGGIAKAWYPFFMSYMNKKHESKVIFSRILTFYFYSIGLICSAYFIFAKPIMFMLANERFHDSYIVVGFVALAHFIQVIFNFFLPGLYFNKKVKYVSLVQGMSALLSVPVFIYLIKNYSIIGCALSICISNLLAALLLYIWNNTLLRDSLNIKYEWARILFISSLFYGIVFFYNLLPESTIYYEFIKSLSIFIILFIITFLSLKFTERDKIINILKIKLKSIFKSQVI